MELGTQNPTCLGFRPGARRTSSTWQGLGLRLRIPRDRATPKAVISLLCLLGFVALPAICLAQQEFLNPLYTQQDLTTDRLLPGTWEMKTRDSSLGNWTIVLRLQPGKTGCYDLGFKVKVPDSADRTLQEKADAMVMTLNACLVKLGQMVFLDVQPKTVPVGATTENFRLAPSAGVNHQNPFSPRLFHIEQNDDAGGLSGIFVTLGPAHGGGPAGAQPEYELRFTPAHWIDRVWIGERTLRISDFNPDGDVATLATRELQKLVLKDAEEGEGFKNADEFKRKNGGSQ